MKIFNPNFRWGKVTTLRQTYSFTGLTYNARWTPQYSDNTDYFVSTSLDKISPFMERFSISNRILLVCENQSIYAPDEVYCQNYGTIISPFEPTNFTGLWVNTQPAIPWFYGIDFSTKTGLLHNPRKINYELKYLAKDRKHKKKKLLSAIVSSKQGLVGHRWRQEVASELKSILKDQIDIFGFGHKPLPDKSLGLDQYKYSLVIENMQHRNYWTEKLSDAFLGRTIPIYCGCPNIRDFFTFPFPELKFGENAKQTALKIIQYIEQSDVVTDEQIEEARNLVLFKYNMMYFVPELIRRF